jgi:2-polyprenyl-3-methyl-5-hydroxy-6-metoxy-1,4-benzoquinol methylase
MAENPSTLLDVGCGRGEFLERLPLPIRRCGIDSLAPEEIPSGIEYRQGDIGGGLPWGDGEFDAIFAGEVIEHLLDTAAFLAECRRVLRPNGLLILTTPNLAYWRNLLQWLRQQQFFFVDHRAGENGHVRYFAPRTLAALLVESGFVVEQLFSIGDLPTSTNALLRVVGRAANRWAALRNLSLVAKARRAGAAPAPPRPEAPPFCGVTGRASIQ